VVELGKTSLLWFAASLQRALAWRLMGRSGAGALQAGSMLMRSISAPEYDNQAGNIITTTTAGDV